MGSGKTLCCYCTHKKPFRRIKKKKFNFFFVVKGNSHVVFLKSLNTPISKIEKKNSGKKLKYVKNCFH